MIGNCIKCGKNISETEQIEFDGECFDCSEAGFTDETKEAITCGEWTE